MAARCNSVPAGIHLILGLEGMQPHGNCNQHWTPPQFSNSYCLELRWFVFRRTAVQECSQKYTGFRFSFLEQIPLKNYSCRTASIALVRHLVIKPQLSVYMRTLIWRDLLMKGANKIFVPLERIFPIFVLLLVLFLYSTVSFVCTVAKVFSEKFSQKKSNFKQFLCPIPVFSKQFPYVCSHSNQCREMKQYLD